MATYLAPIHQLRFKMLWICWRPFAILLLAVSSSSLLRASVPVVEPEGNIVLQWNTLAVQAIEQSNLGAPFAARALAVLHTCMYDAWAAYDHEAVGTELNKALRRPAMEQTETNQQQAVSYAAYRALADLFPEYVASVYALQMERLGYGLTASTDIETPAGIANVACGAVLEFRHQDGANQRGDLAPGAYSDWTQYKPVNLPDPQNGRPAAIADPNHWQPLSYVNASGILSTQRFAGAQWTRVIPFALSGSDQFRSVLGHHGPATYGTREYQAQSEELVRMSATLTDEQKVIAEYWSDGPFTIQPPGHWMRFAQYISKRDRHGLADDVKMFFVLANAMFDAGIAAWDAKRNWDSIRPITAIHLLFNGQKIRAWGGPGKGTVGMEGRNGNHISNPAFPLRHFRTMCRDIAPTAQQRRKFCYCGREATALAWILRLRQELQASSRE